MAKILKERGLSPEDKKLARKIRGYRKKSGMTQWGLSAKIDANNNYIAFVETFRRGVSLPFLYRIAKALKVSLKDLFDF